jgi:hypoxanthine phosphoribosyltransferase
MNKQPFTFKEFKDSIDILYQQIKNSGIQYDRVVGLSRGGLIPAVALSHKLGVPLIPVNWSTTEKKGSIQIMDLVDNVRNKILVVDDILDSGETMKSFLDYHGKMDVGVIYYNTEQSVVPNYYVRSIKRSVFPDWIDFWWETM